MSYRLCPECKDLGYCWFSKAAKDIALGVPVGATFEQANTASNEIATRRIEARKRCCPNLNDIDPNYPRKEEL